MEVENKLELFNPWKVENIDQFLYYCCPECDIKQKTKSDFIIHAIDAHPGSREYLPLFDFEDDDRNLSYLDTLEPLNIEFSLNNRVLVKLEPLSLDGLLKMECDEDDCGRFFVTQESLLNHKNQSHPKKPVKPTKKPKKLELDDDDVVKDIESSEYLESNEEYSTISNDFHQDGESDSSNIILEEKKEKQEERSRASKKRKLTDSDDEYGKPNCKKSALHTHKKSVHSAEPKEAQKTKRPPKYIQAIDPTDGIQKYKCDVDECSMFFNSTRGLRQHKTNSHTNDQVMQKCFVCTDVVPSTLLTIHMHRKHANANAMFVCDLCSEQFKKSNPEQFMYHLTKEHQIGEFRHKCVECDKTFTSNTLLEKHKKIHHEKSSTVICDQCGKECLSKSHLDSHLKKVHHMYKIPKEDTIKKCDKCDLEFEKPEDFNDHLKQCLDDPNDFKCKLCDSSWVSHLSLWQHTAVDHKMIKYICDVCGHASSSATLLKEHKKNVHDKIYDYVCHICAQPKRDKHRLEEHMITVHGQGERKFKCDKCDKCFSRKSILKHHFESHHAKKTLFKCEQCPKTFWMKSYLATHVKMMHENYRPHKCDICHQGFVYKRDVVSHKKHVHNIHE